MLFWRRDLFRCNSIPIHVDSKVIDAFFADLIFFHHLPPCLALWCHSERGRLDKLLVFDVLIICTHSLKCLSMPISPLCVCQSYPMMIKLKSNVIITIRTGKWCYMNSYTSVQFLYFSIWPFYITKISKLAYFRITCWVDAGTKYRKWNQTFTIWYQYTSLI